MNVKCPLDSFVIWKYQLLFYPYTYGRETSKNHCLTMQNYVFECQCIHPQMSGEQNSQKMTCSPFKVFLIQGPRAYKGPLISENIFL